MILNPDQLKYIIDDVNSHDKKEERIEDHKRWLFFHGKTKDIIIDSLSKEFKKPETIDELITRIVPLNIMKKIITKLAGIYVESPQREASDGNESDNELIENLEDSMQMNILMKEGNQYFKLFKRNLIELYVDKQGRPRARNIPRHCYEAYSFDPVSPEYPTVIVKIVKDSNKKEEQLLTIWTDEQHIECNGKGEIFINQMNPDMINPYGCLPFVYINESSTSISPLCDDDLLNVSIAIPVVLTDLLYACRFQCWAIIYTIGAVGDIPVNPNSVIGLQYDENGQKPEIGTIKPSVDSEKIIQLVTNILSILLTTKNLSAGTIKSTINVNDVLSGISKMLDNAENVEDKKDQQAFFYAAERDMWNKLARFMLPYWRSVGMLNEKVNREFSSVFEVSVTFREPKVMISEQEALEISSKKLDLKLTTRKIELQKLYPDYTEDEIDKLLVDIDKENSSTINEINGEENVIEEPIIQTETDKDIQ